MNNMTSFRKQYSSSLPCQDIVFTVTFKDSDIDPESDDIEQIVAPCKCDSHKQTVHGELTTKKPGIYTLIFDNTYSLFVSL